MRKLNWDGIEAFVDEHKDKDIAGISVVIQELAKEQKLDRKASKRRSDVEVRAALQKKVQEQKFKLRALHAVCEVKKMYTRIEKKGTPSGAIPYRTGFHGKCDTTAGTTLDQFLASIGRAVSISTKPKDMPKFGPGGATATDYTVQLVVGPSKGIGLRPLSFCGQTFTEVSSDDHVFLVSNKGVFMLSDEDTLDTVAVPAALAWSILHNTEERVSRRVIGSLDGAL